TLDFRLKGNVVGRFLKILLVAGVLIIAGVTHAQTQTALSLSIPTTNLQTGQDYEIAICVDNAPDFWTADVALNYDPSLVYVVGTKSGSPITPGELFPSESSIVVQNVVRNKQVSVVVSRVGETTPATGSGIIGKFHIYPIAPGKTQITFSRG